MLRAVPSPSYCAILAPLLIRMLVQKVVQVDKLKKSNVHYDVVEVPEAAAFQLNLDAKRAASRNLRQKI